MKLINLILRRFLNKILGAMDKIVKIFLVVIIFFMYITSLVAQTITWQRTYGEEQYIKWGWAIVQLPDEGYIAVCEQRQMFNEMFAMRLDKFGNIVWAKFYPGGRASGIVSTYDGNYLIGGSALIKINIDGDTLWTRFNIRGSNFKLTNDGGFYLCGGRLISPNIVNPHLRKFDSLGFLQWEKTYSNNFFDGLFTDLLINKDNDLVLIGNYSDSSIITENPFIMKTDSVGNPIWFYGYNSDSLNYYYVSQIYQNTKHQFIVGGSNNLNCYFMHFNSDGLLQRINYIDSNVQSVQLNSLINTTDNGFAFTGYYYQNPNYYVRLVKTDMEGNEQWRKLYGDSFSNVGYRVRQTADSGFIIIGNSEYDFKFDIYIIKTDKTGYANPIVNIYTSSTLIPNDFILYQNYPNPFNPETIIEFYLNKKSFININIYNALGQQIAELLSQDLLPGKYFMKFNPDKLNISIPSGIYFYALKSESSLVTKKMLYIK